MTIQATDFTPHRFSQPTGIGIWYFILQNGSISKEEHKFIFVQFSCWAEYEKETHNQFKHAHHFFIWHPVATLSCVCYINAYSPIC